MERQGPRTAQFAQAYRMVKISRIDLAHGHPGDNVAVPLPLVDRGRGDPRNILGVILDCNENNMYPICFKSGILESKYKYARTSMPATSLSTTPFTGNRCRSHKNDHFAPVTEESTSGGQGYVKCNCWAQTMRR